MTAAPPDNKFITVVSGLPRSGTSLMMQMLNAGGMPVLSDHVRSADDDNPQGYFEFEAVKQLKTDRSWLDQAQGKAVKIIHMLLMDLPTDRSYRLVMMNRDLDEVMRSQAKMLERSGKSGAGLPAERLKQMFKNQLATVREWLAKHDCFILQDIHYARLIDDPASQAELINQFLGGNLDVNAMITAIRPELYRNRPKV
jgi:hypothetical protein